MLQIYSPNLVMCVVLAGAAFSAFIMFLQFFWEFIVVKNTVIESHHFFLLRGIRGVFIFLQDELTT